MKTEWRGLLLVTAFHLLIVLASGKRSRKLEDNCSPNDYHFEFTDCDAGGGRWRVAVPDSPECEASIPPIPPRRLSECYKSCEAGQFLNLSSLDCEDCGAGSYSLGGGIVFDEWDPLPKGFKVQTEKFRSMFASIGRQFSTVNCSKWGWKRRKDMVVSQGGPCVALLIYTAQLVKPGHLKFTYQYSDDSVLFQFQANSEQCESLREAEGSRWPSLTGDGVWKTEEIPLHTGLNIFQWKTMGIEASRRPKPVMIKRIEIEGVGYTSSCNPCPVGTFTDKEASRLCSVCPKNSYSGKQATTCLPCDTSNSYSEPGSEQCKKRPACSVTDFYQVHEPCTNNRTRLRYEWVRPKICLDSAPGSVSLPSPDDWKPCPPCNPGTEYRDGLCKPCPSEEFSDGVKSCQKCPSNSKPSQGHLLSQWYSWPESLHYTCISPEDSGCTNSPAWELHGNYTQTGRGHEAWVYLVLTLSVAGFRGSGRIINGELHEAGRVSFTFEMKCAHDCELLFMQGTSSKNASVIQRWIGSRQKEEITHSVYRNDSYDFSWAFQKVALDSVLSPDEGAGGNLVWGQSDAPDEENYVRIYQIQVQNSVDGGAWNCIPCQDGGNGACITCSDFSSSSDRRVNEPSVPASCLPCRPGYVRVDPFSSDSKTCHPCGPGLITKNGLDCITDCTFKTGDFSYDLRPLQGHYSIRGSSLFTASGTQYFHVFNLSLCSDSYATCEKNVSLQHGTDSTSKVEALICQSTIFPPALSAAVSTAEYDPNSNPNGYGGYSDYMTKPLSTHASSLGDHLLGISANPDLLGYTEIPEEIKVQLLNTSRHQLYFFYSTPERTIACPRGRSTAITFRCKPPSGTWSLSTKSGTDADSVEPGVLKTFEGCSDGTCDGCKFHFLWETPFACHLCSEDEITVVKGECKNGLQDIHYLPSQQSECFPRIDDAWPTSQKCQNRLPLFWEVAIEVVGGSAAVLALTLICFWRRHRKLEYKYMKLVASGSSGRGNSSSNSKDHDHNISERDMMPVAESCALDPTDDDDDDEDIYTRQQSSTMSRQMEEVRFQSDGAIRNLVSKMSFLDRLKNLSRRGETGSSLEIMNLTDKDACS